MAGKQVGNIVGHAGGNSTCSTVVCDGHAKERRGDGMGFDVIFLGQACDEAVKMIAVSVFDAVVVNDQGKKCGVSVVCERAWLGLVVTVLEEEGSDVLTCM